MTHSQCVKIAGSILQTTENTKARKRHTHHSIVIHVDDVDVDKRINNLGRAHDVGPQQFEGRETLLM
jgi:hypothetical protein